MPITPDHPQQTLAFFIEDDLSESAVAAMEQLVDHLREARPWVLGPPAFVDQVDEPTGPGADEPVRTVGGFSLIYSGLPPWGDALPHDVDQAQFEETKLLVERLSAFSRQWHVTIALELDEDSIGWIEDGVPDDSVTDALRGEWERHLAEARVGRQGSS